MKAILADYSSQMGKSIFVCEAGGPSTPGNPERLRRGGECGLSALLEVEPSRVTAFTVGLEDHL
jgi:hypothetical protein